MTERPTNLPDFRKPPIDEVAIAVQFPAIDGYKNEHGREFWNEMRQHYPFVENQLTLDVPLESSISSSEPQALQIQFAPAQAPNLRLWLISETDDYLIQVQNTRFIQNWRRRGAEYPHFEDVRELFWANFVKFQEFLTESGLTRPRINQTEVSYINWIPDLSMGQFLRPASEALVTAADSQIEPESQSWTARYLVPDDPGITQRLYVQVSPAVRAQDTTLKGSQFALVARAAKEDGLSDADTERLIDGARSLIVEAFASLTTPHAHRAWERLQ